MWFEIRFLQSNFLVEVSIPEKVLQKFLVYTNPERSATTAA
jgi:hypothetical protein